MMPLFPERKKGKYVVELGLKAQYMYIRVRPRFFDQVGHQTTNASIGNKYFFNKLCHRQTYQNYEQPPGTSQNSYF